jgi:hypothetical protein
MTAKKGAVVHLHRLDPEDALERLNRITGLRFAHWPESLVQPVAESAVEVDGASDALDIVEVDCERASC